MLSSAIIVVWLAVGLFSDVGVSVSPAYETKAECEAAVVYARAQAEVVDVTECVPFKLTPKTKT